ncbi:MAG: response regulator [Patescibacteria group bacterium]
MKKVLIIDDDVTFQLTMANKLKEGGYATVAALDGEAGLEQVKAEKPDLILLDVNMPKLDGIGFLKKLQEAYAGEKQIPVYITSNLSAIDKISEGVSLGIKGYILKSDESLDTILSGVDSTLNPRPTEYELPEAPAA